MKSLAFRNGIAEMKNLLLKLQSEEGSSVTSPGINFVPDVQVRRLTHLDKDALQREEEENNRMLDKKIIQDVETLKWKCRDCPWTGKFQQRAKNHARVCGLRQKMRSKKQHKSKQFQCSSIVCPESFNKHS